MTAEERDFIAAFQDASLPTSAFRHYDHVHMAWLYVRCYGQAEAAHRFTADLRRYAEAKGVPGLYHATITGAYVALIAERVLATAEDADWPSFAAANPDLLRWKPGVLETYYSPDRLWSDQARRVFLLPDLPSAPSA